MATLNTAANKHGVTTKRNSMLAWALFIRKVNRSLALFGRVMHSSSLAQTK